MKLKPNVAISDSGFVFDANSGESFSVNPIGLEILNEIKLAISKEEIIQKLLSRYEVEPYTLEQNINDFFMLLRKYEMTEE